MPVVRLFSGHQIEPSRAPAVIAPSYDALTAAERRAYAAAHPSNFLNAMRSVDDYPEGAAPDEAALLAENAGWVASRLADGTYRAARDCLFVYRLRADAHQQRGIVAEMPVSEYLSGRLKRHEHTRPSKENVLADYIDEVGAASSPVCAAYREHPEIDDAVAGIEAREPDIEFVSRDGVEHAVWRVEGPAAARLCGLFAEVGDAYLTDGHHRCAATARFLTGTDEANLLVAMFPVRDLRILAYHRAVTGLDAIAPDRLLERLGEPFEIEPVVEAEAEPTARGDFGMYLDSRWYRLRCRGQVRPSGDPAAMLDVSILQERVLDPLLGIASPRDDRRLGYVAGSKGLAALREACGGDGIGFAVYPTSMTELMAVADGGMVMPPKSTWFDPKVRSGFFLNDPLRLRRRARSGRPASGAAL